MSQPAIAAEGLGKRFGRAIALEGVDLAVPRGGCLAVMGPNGAGKTTLLRLMAGLARPTAGALQIGGQRATGREARARVGYVAHASFLYPELSARENLIFAARLHGLPDAGARADALLAEEGLADAADTRAGAVSRGTAQRLAIARGLAHDPDVVLLDEPFTGLDRRAADRLAGRLERLREAGRTLVIVTHDLRRVAPLADAAIALAGGRIASASHGRAGPDELERAYLAAVDATP